MMRSLSRFVRGTVTFSVRGDSPERLINKMNEAGLSFWNVVNRKEGFRCSLYAADYPKLRPLAKQTACKIRISQKRGIGFILRPYRKRYGIAVGIGLYFAVLFLMSLFCWNVKVTGNEQIETTALLQAMKELGVKEGCLISSIDARRFPAEIELKVGGIAHAALNIEDTVVTLEITEVKDTEFLPTEPSNLVASADGSITAVKVKNGALCVKVGDSVTKGQVLASGVVENKDGTSRTVRAYGEVIAQTVETRLYRIKTKQRHLIKTGRSARVTFLSSPWFSVPLDYFSTNYEKYGLEKYESRIRNGDAYLPIGLTEIVKHEMKEILVELDRETMKSEIELQMEKAENRDMSSAKILNKKVEYNETEEELTAKVIYTLEKNIATEEKIGFGIVNPD